MLVAILSNTASIVRVRTAFTQGANFTGMNGGKEPLYVSTAVHKAFIGTNEAGTEAAAASGIGLTEGAAPGTQGGPSIPVFRADHPFVFAVRDVRTGVILFMGRCMDPTAKRKSR